MKGRSTGRRSTGIYAWIPCIGGSDLAICLLHFFSKALMKQTAANIILPEDERFSPPYRSCISCALADRIDEKRYPRSESPAAQRIIC